MKDACPERYRVDRVGTPDPPDSQYFVLDVVHDRHAREVLMMLIRKYRFMGPSARADELERLLQESEADFARNVRARTQKVKAERPRTSNRLVAKRRP